MARARILKKRSAIGARVRGAMPVQRVFLLLCLVLESLMSSDHCGSPRHFLRYSYLKVSEPTQGLPRFLIVIHLDDEPIAQYDTHNGKTVPLVHWMEEEEMKIPERILRSDLEWLSNLNWTGGPYTWQVTLCCEVREDGSKGWSLRYGYDGMDFISFDKESLRWVTAQPQAQEVKEEWEEDQRWSQRNKVFLEETCIEWLQKYLPYQKEALKKTEPPVGNVTHKVVNDSMEVLICQAFGFYPKEIQATWRKDGEVCQNETIHRNVAPNSDGTYYVWLSIAIKPKERHHYQCHLEHKGLQKPLVLSLKEETDMPSFPLVGMVMIIILAFVILILISCGLIYRKKLHQVMKTCLNHLPSENVHSSPTCDIENEIQSQVMLPAKVTSEGCCGQKRGKGPSEEQADELLAGEEMGEAQL